MLRELRDDPRLADLPVVVMSALDAGELEAQAAQADDFLPKPFQADALTRRLARAMEQAGCQTGAARAARHDKHR